MQILKAIPKVPNDVTYFKASLIFQLSLKNCSNLVLGSIKDCVVQTKNFVWTNI